MFKFNFTWKDAVRVAWAGGAAFVAVYAPLASGLGQYPNLSSLEAAAVALVPAATTAAIIAIKNAILADGTKLKG